MGKEFFSKYEFSCECPSCFHTVYVKERMFWFNDKKICQDCYEKLVQYFEKETKENE